LALCFLGLPYCRRGSLAALRLMNVSSRDSTKRAQHIALSTVKKLEYPSPENPIDDEGNTSGPANGPITMKLLHTLILRACSNVPDPHETTSLRNGREESVEDTCCHEGFEVSETSPISPTNSSPRRPMRSHSGDGTVSNDGRPSFRKRLFSRSISSSVIAS
jgi:hypothetical protein